MSQDSPRNALATDNSLRASELYEFGSIAVDAGRHRVTRDGHPVALPPKTYELLLVLVKSGGRAVSRHELMSALWPDTFVEEANLSFQISTLRKALGEGADAWIETVPRVGYRFTPDVTRDGTVHGRASARPISVETPIAHPQAANASPLTDTRARGRWVRRVALALATLTLVGVVLFGFVWSRAEPLTHYDGRPVPLTSLPGSEGVPSLSSDGSMVAFSYSASATDVPAIYVKPVVGGEPLRLTERGTNAYQAAYSPDGGRVAFLRGVPGSAINDLMIVPALGGAAHRVLSLIVQAPPAGAASTNLMSWTPDGRWIAVGATIDEKPGIWLVNIDGAPPRRLTTPTEQSDRAPSISADGRRVAFIRRAGLASEALHMLALDARLDVEQGPSLIVNPRPLQVISATWDRSDRALVYSVGTYGGTSTLRRVALRADRLGPAGDPETLPVGEQARGLDMAPSGRLVYVRRQRDTGFRTLDLLHPELGLNDASLPASSRDESTPHYSPDGTRLAFASTRSGAEEIWIANADGTNPRQVTTMSGPECANPQWSPDGTRIVFSSTAAGSFDLYLLDPETTAARRLTSDEGMEDHPRWSRDGRWIYFNRWGDRPGITDIWKVSPDGGSPVRVTTGGGAVAEESPDGATLFYSRVDGDRVTLWRKPVAGGPPTQLGAPLRNDDGADGFRNVNFAVGRHAVYVLVNGARRSVSEIRAIEHATGRTTTLAQIGGSTWYGVALSPDEHTLIVSVLNSAKGEIMLAEPMR